MAEGGGLKGALVSIDAVSTGAKIEQAIKDKGTDYLLAIKVDQPTLCAETESAFAAATEIGTFVDSDKANGRMSSEA